MKKLILAAIAVVIVAVSFGAMAIFGRKPPAVAALAAPKTLSPYEIHQNYNYRAMKELPVHDSKNAF